MRIALVGPGRAGQSVAIAARGAGHEIIAVSARDTEQAVKFGRRFDALPLAIGEPIPPVDLVIIAVRDDAIADVADTVAPVARNAAATAIHLSGATPVSALDALATEGISTGSFHPLQTLPDPDRGARALPGAWVAVTAEEPLRSSLHDLARSMGCHPFDLEDENRTAYHAAAAASANFPIAALVIAERLLDTVGLPLDAAKPLVEAIVANAFTRGPAPSLTGPIARGDTATVESQMKAVRAAAPELASAFEAMVDATAAVASTIVEEEPA
ncbi:MAG: DUF2520 domain-containing protein [Actinomycetota bacterium]